MPHRPTALLPILPGAGARGVGFLVHGFGTSARVRPVVGGGQVYQPLGLLLMAVRGGWTVAAGGRRPPIMSPDRGGGGMALGRRPRHHNCGVKVS